MSDERAHDASPTSALAAGVAGVIQRTIINGELPALIVIHDDEGDWLIGDGINDPNEDGACGIYHLAHVVSLDESLTEVMNIPIGYGAKRESASAPWEISPWAYDD
ncbi:hypothetical protein [Streptomyces sp. NPDC058755]|uniref:hypothetical protein n=1 Tax=Streptomyces sp. NPDC058755 TaxID=3346624 RepID=UPI0036774418